MRSRRPRTARSLPPGLSRASIVSFRNSLTKNQRLKHYQPYAKQKLFHNYGARCGERLLRAGNQQGKTLAGAMELAMHLTGLYPDWWEGRRFAFPVEAWAACDTLETTRDNPQAALLGRMEPWGDGAIPGEALLGIERGRGSGVARVLVRHVSGGVSRLGFKSYDQGRTAWQGPSKHAIWCDEEPPADVYGEALARLVATGGMIFTTFTPLKGRSAVVDRLMSTADGLTCADVNMTIDEALHIGPRRRAQVLAAFPAHERDARAYGVPAMGSGRVFPVDERALACTPFTPPPHWAALGAMDFGWEHPFAAVKLFWDRDADCVYVTEALRVRHQTPGEHSAALKAWGPGLLFAWPHDGGQTEKGSGVKLAEQYRARGLKLLPAAAAHASGGNAVEAGIMAMLERMKDGRLRVFAGLGEWFEEFRHYHRDAGRVVKERDDLMCATRYGVMMLRFAAPLRAAGAEEEGAFAGPRRHDPLAGFRSAGGGSQPRYDPLG